MQWPVAVELKGIDRLQPTQGEPKLASYDEDTESPATSGRNYSSDSMVLGSGCRVKRSMHFPFSKLILQSICFATVTIVGLSTVGNAEAQDCEAMSGPTRTDCFIGRARILGLQSDIAAGKARLRADEERLRAATGASIQPRSRVARSKHKVR
jgi:hypothetical protein